MLNFLLQALFIFIVCYSIYVAIHSRKDYTHTYGHFVVIGFSSLVYILIRIFQFVFISMKTYLGWQNILFFVIPVFELAVLLCFCIPITIRNTKKGKALDEAKKIAEIEKIKSNPIYIDVIKCYKSNPTYGAIYICMDGVAFCPRHNPHFTSTQAEEERWERGHELKSAVNNWIKEHASHFSVSLISSAQKSFIYRAYGFENISDVSLMTTLIAEELNLKYDFCCKTFFVRPSHHTSGPTGAVTYNGITTFTGYSSSTEPGESLEIHLLGVAYDEQKVIKEPELQSW